MNPLANGSGTWKRTGPNQVVMVLPLSKNDPTLANLELVHVYLNQIIFLYPRITHADYRIETVAEFGPTLVVTVHGFIDQPF